MKGHGLYFSPLRNRYSLTPIMIAPTVLTSPEFGIEVPSPNITNTVAPASAPAASANFVAVGTGWTGPTSPFVHATVLALLP